MANRSIGNSASYRNAQSPRQQTTDASTTSETATAVTTTTTTNTTTTTTTTSTSPATVTTSLSNTAAIAVAPMGIPTPTVSVPDLPTDIIGCLIQHLRTRQPARDFAFDVRNFSLVSRRLNEKVFTIFNSAAGQAFRAAWALHESEFPAAMFSRDCKTKASLPGRKKLNPFANGTRPPKELKTLLKQGEALVLKFSEQKNQEPIYRALIEWGKQLPLSNVTICCDAFSGLMMDQAPDREFFTHLGMLNDLLTVLRRNPNAKTMKIVLRVRGCGSIDFLDSAYLARFDERIRDFVNLVVDTRAVKDIELWDVPMNPSWNMLANREGLIARRDDLPLGARATRRVFD